ncbi:MULTISPECIES: PotD/PotF family extracellular solute-binding protein [unclassified Mycolicibacterium]|uniref:ABC transporter substrate-binding protein n=2 Tax=Mycolicibacterium TaxID=1866885 RepID=UPI0012DFC6A9|nr:MULTISPECIES: spermidine/putrescine ABC transporter substrate-binding protein [unclassified Mycolicibacterium]MUL81434.1 spermidine/putrescine ABC transporter substrate-binding protein [Mycolicibacterium sp. CBMA 329]MUL87200.1 spermidine/putrescine ABC transporter substrate-binding protein [Mycolicibacterium sp. CBMA 331]MUL98518.1 spermidine/putrescine ABC transporter substrate-binding protein [Mycolicibacterium sp. CBMA 334]MUM37497.1 spermidine/putrescine ABC transporter substrate-bindin
MDRLRILASPSDARRITRRSLLAGFAVAGTGLALSGCSSGGAPSPPADGVMEDQLNIYSWGDYDDPDNLAEFGRRGVTIQVDNFGSNEELVAKLGAARGTSGYDVVVPTGSYIPTMAHAGLLEKLDHSYLPNLANVEPMYRHQPWDRTNQYAVCKNWGTTGFVYDTRVIDRELTSWSDFLDAAQKEARGKTSVLEDPWEVCSIFFAANGFNLNTTNERELDACERFMVEKFAPTISAFVSQVSAQLAQRQFALMQAFNGDVRLALLEDDDPDRWRFVFPTPTANLWMDTWAIAKGAQHPDAAYAFINYMLEPEAGMKEMEYIGYPTGLIGQRQLAMQNEVPMIDLIYPTQTTLDRLTPGEVTDATARLVKIFNRVQAGAAA